MEKGFFEFFHPKNSSERLKIPTAYMDYKNGKLPRKVSLRDRFGNMWPIEVARIGKDSYFQYGWEKFVEENKVKYGDFLIFDYDEKGVFDFKHMGTTCCEKKRAGGLKLAAKEEEKEEINDDHQMNVEPEGKWLSDSSSRLSDSDDDYIVVEEEVEEDKEYDVVEEKVEEVKAEENERATIICKKKDTRSRGRRVNEEEVEKEEDEVETEKAPHSKYRPVEEEKDTKKAPSSKHRFMEEEEDDEEEQEEENERASISMKEILRSKCGFAEEEDEEYEETEEGKEDSEKASILKEKAPHSKRRFTKEEEDDEEEECDEEEEEEENERAGTFKKKASCSKAGCKRVSVRKERYYYDHYGTEIFKSGRATQPKNPYFVAKIRAERRNQLYVPIAVVRDNKLKLPSSMTIRSAGKEYETKLKIWKDGRIWLHGGWRSLCRWNLVEKNDWCICEFVRGKGKKGLYLRVQVLHEGASSNSSKKK
ncbi:B3 domain-containing protein At5g60140-like [Lycium ferocissimum]|uniref:B3 domain-containing protein At5g60140-like n=1 Tax=Lycium ferocissimum TaxID=112874 RepID=UPI0028168162|nr:B3 domain-containing protein At5g60140-like [Lycium ferocissimum]